MKLSKYLMYITVALFLISLAAAVITPGNPGADSFTSACFPELIGEGTEEDPCRFPDSQLGITEDCNIVPWYVFDGDGTTQNPFTHSSFPVGKGITCTPGEVRAVNIGSAQARILHLGDSHTAGSYGNTIHTLLSQVGVVETYGCGGAAAATYKIQGRCGASGSIHIDRNNETSQLGAAPYIPNLIIDFKPTVVIISLGTNFQNAVRTNSQAEDIKFLVNEATKNNAVCYWIGAPVITKPDFYADQINSVLVELVKPCIFIDPTSNTKTEDLQDGVHFNEKGGEEWAQAIKQRMNLQTIAPIAHTGAFGPLGGLVVDNAINDYGFEPNPDVPDVGDDAAYYTPAATTPTSSSDSIPTRIREIDEVWHQIASFVSKNHEQQVYVPNLGWRSYNELYATAPPTTIDTSAIRLPSKVASKADDTKVPLSILFDKGFAEGQSVAKAEISQTLATTLVSFAQRARSLGYNKPIIVTSASRDGSGLHASGNAVDIHTNTLTLAERLILLRAAIETGFGEIFIGEKSGSVALTTEENNRLKCFWLDGHGNHLHIGLQAETQRWETCAQNAFAPKTKDLTAEQKSFAQAAAARHGVDPKLAIAVVSAESRGNPNAISQTGCAGLMQICTKSSPKDIIKVQCAQRGFGTPQYCKISTCRDNGEYINCDRCPSSTEPGCQLDDRFNVAKNIEAGVRVLKGKESAGALCMPGVDAIKCQVAAYNAGGAIIRAAVSATGKQNPTWNEVYGQMTLNLFLDNGYRGALSESEINAKIRNLPGYVNHIASRYSS